MAAFNKVRNAAAMGSSSEEGSAKNVGITRGGKSGSDGGSQGGGGGGGGGGGSDTNSDGKTNHGGSSGSKLLSQKSSQWHFLKRRLNIRGGPSVSGGSLTNKSSLLGNPILIRTTSKKSITTNASNSNHSSVTTKVENTYQLGPDRHHTFRPMRVRSEVESVLEDVLKDERYDSARFGIMSVRISEAVKDRVKTLGFPRHKLVVQTMLSSSGGQSFQLASRCLWNAETDNYTTAVYQGMSFFAVVTVYGLYYE